MHRIALAVLAVLALAVGTGTSEASHDDDIEALFPDRSGSELEYLAAYRCVVDELGVQTAGRNYVLLGYNAKDGDRPPTDVELSEGTERLETACHPPVVEAVPSTQYGVQTTNTDQAVAPAPASGSGCVGMEAESGSTGYATDTGNGYIGCYQIDEDLHYGPGGSCEGIGTDPAGQDTCAAILCSESGSAPWADSGANPC